MQFLFSQVKDSISNYVKTKIFYIVFYLSYEFKPVVYGNIMSVRYNPSFFFLQFSLSPHREYQMNGYRSLPLLCLNASMCILSSVSFHKAQQISIKDFSSAMATG